MIDIRAIRAEPDTIRRGIVDRGGRYLPVLEDMLKKDTLYREVLTSVEALRAGRNEASAKIGRLKSQKEEAQAAELLKEADAIKEELDSKEAEVSRLGKEVEELLLSLPNVPDPSVPVGNDPKANKVVRENMGFKRNFDFTPEDHHSLGEGLGIIDFRRAGNLSGSRFALLKGAGARLERALIHFMLDVHTREKGYTEIFPPFLVNTKTMTGAGQLPKFEQELYKVAGDGLYLIPTAEVPLMSLHQGEALDEGQLPFKYVSYTACFRREAGSYGKDTRGLIRNHQFNKVELVWVTRPEDSNKALEELTRDAEDILSRLEIPYRVVELCTGDLGFASLRTYDLETWMPGENRFREISSCSNCGDFQARRIGIRMKRAGSKKLLFTHTLNGSGVAVGRTLAAILENYQRADGSIEVPGALRDFMGMDSIAACG